MPPYYNGVQQFRVLEFVWFKEIRTNVRVDLPRLALVFATFTTAVDTFLLVQFSRYSLSCYKALSLSLWFYFRCFFSSFALFCILYSTRIVLTYQGVSYLYLQTTAYRNLPLFASVNATETRNEF